MRPTAEPDSDAAGKVDRGREIVSIARETVAAEEMGARGGAARERIPDVRTIEEPTIITVNRTAGRPTIWTTSELSHVSYLVYLFLQARA